MLMCRLTLTNTKKCTCSHANKFAKTQNENLSHLFLFFFRVVEARDTITVAICESFEVLEARGITKQQCLESWLNIG